MQTNQLTDEQKEYRGNYLAEIFKLKRDKEFKDRYITEWGNKSAIGIYEIAKRIIERGE